jgi:hypothetical protein
MLFSYLASPPAMSEPSSGEQTYTQNNRIRRKENSKPRAPLDSSACTRLLSQPAGPIIVFDLAHCLTGRASDANRVVVSLRSSALSPLIMFNIVDYFVFLHLRVMRPILDSYSRLQRTSRTPSFATTKSIAKLQTAASMIPA